jgi:hypothetical protein
MSESQTITIEDKSRKVYDLPGIIRGGLGKSVFKANSLINKDILHAFFVVILASISLFFLSEKLRSSLINGVYFIYNKLHDKIFKKNIPKDDPTQN